MGLWCGEGGRGWDGWVRVVVLARLNWEGWIDWDRGVGFYLVGGSWLEVALTRVLGLVVGGGREGGREGGMGNGVSMI